MWKLRHRGVAWGTWVIGGTWRCNARFQPRHSRQSPRVLLSLLPVCSLKPSVHKKYTFRRNEEMQENAKKRETSPKMPPLKPTWGETAPSQRVPSGISVHPCRLGHGNEIKLRPSFGSSAVHVTMTVYNLYVNKNALPASFLPAT